LNQGPVPGELLREAATALQSRGIDPGLVLPGPVDRADGQRATGPGRLDGGYLESLPLASRRERGQYYTPAWLVEDVLDWLDWPGEWKQLVDPSCGTGAFLVAAARRLATQLEASGVTGGPALARIAGSLRGYDVDPVALFLCKVNLVCALEKLYRQAGSQVPQWQLQPADVLYPRLGPLAPGTAVAGNPPWGARLPEVPPGSYVSERESACWFTEAILRALPPGGRCVLVLPDIILFKHYPRIRRFILEHAQILRVGVAGRSFPGVSMEAVVLDLAAGGGGSDSPVEILVSLPDGTWTRPPAALPGAFRSHPSLKFNALMSERAVALKERMEQDKVPLGTLFVVREGIHSGNIRHKLFVPAYPGPEGRPLILGRRELRPFVLTWEGRYVRYDPGLVRRSDREYASLGREPELASAKVLVRRTGDRLTAAYDRRGLFPSNNFLYCLPRPGRSLPPELLAALLNSRVLGDYLRLVHPMVNRAFAEIKLIHLRDLPLPAPEDPRLQQAGPDLFAIHRKGEAGLWDPPTEESLEELTGWLYGLTRPEASELRRLSLALAQRR